MSVMEQHNGESNNMYPGLIFDEQGVLMDADLAEYVTAYISDLDPQIFERARDMARENQPENLLERIKRIANPRQIYFGAEDFSVLAIGFHRKSIGDLEEPENADAYSRESVVARDELLARLPEVFKEETLRKIAEY